MSHAGQGGDSSTSCWKNSAPSSTTTGTSRDRFLSSGTGSGQRCGSIRSRMSGCPPGAMNTKENGYLSLGDLAEISTYHLLPGRGVAEAGSCYRSDGHLQKICLRFWTTIFPGLRFYASLKPQQRKLLAGEHGLNGQMLTSEQWKLAQPMFDRIGIKRGEA